MGNRRVRLRVEQPITADYQEIERGEYDGEGAVRARKKAAQIRILSGISNWAAGGIDAAGGDAPIFRDADLQPFRNQAQV